MRLLCRGTPPPIFHSAPSSATGHTSESLPHPPCPAPPQVTSAASLGDLVMLSPSAGHRRSCHHVGHARDVRAPRHRRHGPLRPLSARGQAAAHRPTRPCGLPRTTGRRPWQTEAMGQNWPITVSRFSLFSKTFIRLNISEIPLNF
jgi:hypothetical protein